MTINKKREILQASFLFLSLTCLSSASFSMEPAEESKSEEVGAAASGLYSHSATGELKKSDGTDAENFITFLRAGTHHEITAPFLCAVEAASSCNPSRPNHCLELLNQLPALISLPERNIFFYRLVNWIAFFFDEPEKQEQCVDMMLEFFNVSVPVIFLLHKNSYNLESLEKAQAEQFVLATQKLLDHAQRITSVKKGLEKKTAGMMYDGHDFVEADSEEAFEAQLNHFAKRARSDAQETRRFKIQKRTLAMQRMSEERMAAAEQIDRERMAQIQGVETRIIDLERQKTQILAAQNRARRFRPGSLGTGAGEPQRLRMEDAEQEERSEMIQLQGVEARIRDLGEQRTRLLALQNKRGALRTGAGGAPL